MADTQHLADLAEQARRRGQRQLAEVEVQHFAVEEIESVAAGGEGAERVAVGLGDGLEELTDLRQAQVAGVAFAVEEDEAAAPVGEGGHSWLGVSALAGGLAQLVEQTGRRR